MIGKLKKILPWSKNDPERLLKEMLLTNPDDWSFLSSATNLPNVTVNESTLLQISATWSAIRLISETVATLPIKIYRRTDKGPIAVPDHPLHRLLNFQPNPYFTAVDARESSLVSLLTAGQAYIRVDRFNGRVVGLMPITKSCVRPEVIKNGRDLIYHVTENHQTTKLERGEIVPVRGFGSGLEGFAPHQLQKNSLAVGITAEQYGAKFFASGARPTGVLSADHVLTETQRSRLRTNIAEVLDGDDIAKRIFVLEAAMKWQTITSPNDEAQFIETRKFAIAEVARIYRTPLHMLFEMDRATYNNSYNENHHFLTYTLKPYLTRFEQAYNSTLLTRNEQRRYYIEFDVNGLLRGSPIERAQFYKDMRIAGAMTQNEIRHKENMPAVEGGDDLHVPLNMAPADKLTEILTGGKDGKD